LVSISRAHLRPGLGLGRCAGTCISQTRVVQGSTPRTGNEQ
jgi:hypothetical protein